MTRRTGRGLLLAQRIGTTGDIQVVKHRPYLVEGYDLLTASQLSAPKLLPVSGRIPRGTGKRPSKSAGLIVHISRMTLDETRLGPQKVLTESSTFGAAFRLVDDGSKDYATYEALSAATYSQMPGPLEDLRQAFDRALLLRNRALTARQDYVVLSPLTDLVSTEALTFALLFHLSNMVRYRPHHVDALAGGRYWWLFTSWVDRACENLLLTLSSRISLEEHVIN